MAQKTFVSGDVLTASDINTYLMGEGGAWTSWTPTVTQSGSVTVTVTRARYARYGRTIHFTASLSVTGSGSSANAVVLSLPVTAAAASGPCGSAVLVDSSASTNYPAIAYIATTTTIQLYSASTSSTASVLGLVDFTAGLASGDLILYSGTYEAAS